jgi:hypothetical protein
MVRVKYELVSTSTDHPNGTSTAAVVAAPVLADGGLDLAQSVRIAVHGEGSSRTIRARAFELLRARWRDLFASPIPALVLRDGVQFDASRTHCPPRLQGLYGRFVSAAETP